MRSTSCFMLLIVSERRAETVKLVTLILPLPAATNFARISTLLTSRLGANRALSALLENFFAPPCSAGSIPRLGGDRDLGVRRGELACDWPPRRLMFRDIEDACGRCMISVLVYFCCRVARTHRCITTYGYVTYRPRIWCPEHRESLHSDACQAHLQKNIAGQQGLWTFCRLHRALAQRTQCQCDPRRTSDLPPKGRCRGLSRYARCRDGASRLDATTLAVCKAKSERAPGCASSCENTDTRLWSAIVPPANISSPFRLPEGMLLAMRPSPKWGSCSWHQLQFLYHISNRCNRFFLQEPNHCRLYA
jgi:hypothetical protein